MDRGFTIRRFISKPERVHPIDGIISNIPVQVEIPAREAQRVLGDEAAHGGIIVPCLHVVKAVRFGHYAVLADELEGLGGGFLLGEDLPEGIVGVGVGRVLVGVG